ncbi:MAG: 16S rRNA (adenine(1518)-N(6)/adenine(1519)-N(6))-dimethyltransferase RsmA [Halanaerobiaceae bacterium]
MDRIIACPGITRDILREYNLQLYKGMGQNFLVDRNILQKVVSAASLSTGDNVIEIGAGIGALTQQILQEPKFSGKLIAIEKDERFVQVLRNIFSGNKKLAVINRDVLEIEWKNFLRKYDFSPPGVKIMGNLPYYITTPIIMGFLEGDVGVSRLVFMVQKEVGERIVARPGTKEFGALSVAVQFYAQADIVSKVPPTVFVPRPDVESCIIKVVPHQESRYRVENRDFFFKMVKAIFQQRRKIIKNSLLKSSVLNPDKEAVLKSLNEAGVDSRIRGEKLSLNKMTELSNCLWKNIEKNNCNK